MKSKNPTFPPGDVATSTVSGSSASLRRTRFEKGNRGDCMSVAAFASLSAFSAAVAAVAAAAAATASMGGDSVHAAKEVAAVSMTGGSDGKTTVNSARSFRLIRSSWNELEAHSCAANGEGGAPEKAYVRRFPVLDEALSTFRPSVRFHRKFTQ